FSNDVPGRNLLATRNTARYHEDHSQLHAANIRERRTQRRLDLCATGPSPDQHDHSTGLSSVFHRTRQFTNELERRIGTTGQPKPVLNRPGLIPRPSCSSIKASLRTTDCVE